MRCPARPRYQSNSAAKLLICMASLFCFFSGHFRKSLDLQGPARAQHPSINKVIHRNLGRPLKRFQIKYLQRFSKMYLKTYEFSQSGSGISR
jgi:hypothetical protein